jgi:extracellular factor (EF) 3-hydroxypalmitic acid methyl ester biosynthesis protein
MNYFYEILAPGGLLVATNVDQYNPSRNWMDLVVDWHLVYRDAERMQAMKPAQATSAATRIWSEPTSVNIFMELRKPANV